MELQEVYALMDRFSTSGLTALEWEKEGERVMLRREGTASPAPAAVSVPSSPVPVEAEEGGLVVGYAFCVYQLHRGEGAFNDMTTLYLDDLCVDEACRGQHVGRALYQAAVELARSAGCYNLTLNVWSCNDSARRFYEKCGLRVQKIGMEAIL